MLIIVKREDGKCGVKNSDTNHFIIPTEYDEVKRNNSIGFIVKKGHLFGVLKFDGSLLIPIEYDRIEVLSRNNPHKNYIQVTKNKLLGIFSVEGESIVPVEYNQINGFYSDFGTIFLSNTNNLIGAFYEDGKEIAPPEYEMCPVLNSNN